MVESQKSNPTESIGKAKELIESCCKIILSKIDDVTVDDKWNMPKLINKTIKQLNLSPENIDDTKKLSNTLKSILGSLYIIANGMAELRNDYGSGHGKGPNYKGLQERHAKLAVGSAVTLVNFLWDSYELQKETGKIKTQDT